MGTTHDSVGAISNEASAPLKKVFLAHNTCLNAAYDLNVLQAGLVQVGAEIVDRPELADEIIFSGCSVREHWVDDAVTQIAEAQARAPHARLTITGCVANTSASTVAERLPSKTVSFIPMREILGTRTGLDFNRVDRAVSQTSADAFEPSSTNGLPNLRRRVGATKASIVAELQMIDREWGSSLERLYRETTKGFVFYDEMDPCAMITITRSCLYKCSFCNIPKGRGPFESVPMADILAKAGEAVATGVRHIVLIGDEVGNYGAGREGQSLPRLIAAILELHPALALSIRYIEPKPFLKFADALRIWSQAGRIRLLYISLQSGSSRTLKAMNRGYDIARLADALRTFRDQTPTILYGNWMVGFPGEREEDFVATLELVSSLSFHINTAIPFSPRPDTPAQSMPEQVETAVLSDRLRRLELVIADLKTDAMSAAMKFLSEDSRSSLRRRIRLAEGEQYVSQDDGADARG